MRDPCVPHVTHLERVVSSSSGTHSSPSNASLSAYSAFSTLPTIPVRRCISSRIPRTSQQTVVFPYDPVGRRGLSVMLFEGWPGREGEGGRERQRDWGLQAVLDATHHPRQPLHLLQDPAHQQQTVVFPYDPAGRNIADYYGFKGWRGWREGGGGGGGREREREREREGERE
jgi:hypothetical protein